MSQKKTFWYNDYMHIKNEDELIALGQELGSLLEKNDVLILTGELGAGKTTLTKGLAKELISDGIIVNGLAPGSTATPLLGFKEGDSISSDENMLGRLVLPDEIAEWAKMLVGPSGRMVAGETVLVAGGRGGFDIR